LELLLLAVVVVVAVVGVIVVLVIRTSKAAGKELAGRVAPAPDAPYNMLAIVAFVLAFFVSIAAIVCGHLALRDIQRRNERGRGLAIAALWIGYATLAITIATGVVFLVITLR
jgi:hypothetical protein